ncbi:MAG: pyridoxal phosphate-dependent aminotransferase [Bacteroidia bacterium]|nr:pyridoxal phosphate-dependent aminotransferase [Bacteroidia bacterium]MDW8133515.1 pyridoxal phosphate-dependent aminotransferase [Bacteroidia bacterium]
MIAERSVARRIAELSEAQTLGMAQRVRELRASGKEIVSLLLGEPDFPVPSLLQEAAIQAIREGYAPYPPVPGLSSLREAIASYYHKHYGLPFEPSQVVVSNGSKQAIYNALLSILEPGDEVIVPAPYWVSYIPLIQLAEGVPVVVSTTPAEGYKLTPEKLAQRLSSRSCAIILCSPSNPTGSAYTPAELSSLAEVLESYPKVWIISDEIYELIRYGGKHFSPAQVPPLYERTIVCNGFSKAFAMPGWRLGYLIAPLPVAQAAIKVQGQTTAGANIIAQKAALAGLQDDIHRLVEPMISAFRERRDWIYEYITQHLPEMAPYLPDGAFYFFLDIAAFIGRSTAKGKVIQSADDIAEYLLEEGVGVVSGTGFGSKRHIRISYAVSLASIQEGMQRMMRALRALA